MTAVVVMSAVLVVLVAAFIAFYLHARTPEWGESELRKSLLRMLVVIGPYLGMNYKPPRPEPPAVTATGDEPDTLPVREDQGEG